MEATAPSAQGGVERRRGIAVRIGGGGKLHVESRIHRAYHSPTNTAIVPPAAGIRF